MAIVIDFFVLTAWVAFYSSCIEVYQSQFKDKIIQKIINFIDSEQAFKYIGDPLFEDNYQTKVAFIHSQLFPKVHQTSYLYQSDRVQGTIDKTDVYFSALHAASESEKKTFLPSWLINRDTHSYGTPQMTILYMLYNLPQMLLYITTRLLQGQKIDSRNFNEVFLGQMNRKTIFKGL